MATYGTHWQAERCQNSCCGRSLSSLPVCRQRSLVRWK